MRRWLHRKGYVRLHNAKYGPTDAQGGAYIETVGPVWLARWLAVNCVKHGDLTRCDWRTIRVTKTEQLSRWRYRWLFAFTRISA